MLKVLVGPTQDVPPLVKVGVTTIVPLIGAVVKFAAVNEIWPVPVAASPMVALVLVQA